MRRPTLFLAFSIVALAAVALAIRLPRLEQRPMHGDEANQAVKTGGLLETGVYRYDPDEHHGPTLYWATLPSLWLSGVRTFAESREWDYRVVPVVFGLGLILLLPLAADGLGVGPLLVAGLLTAVSPAMVYYARDYIQETLLVFFTFAAIGCGWRYFRRPSVGWAVGFGASIGLVHATKETWVLAGAAMGAGVVLTALWTRWRDGTPWMFRPYLRPWAVLAALAAACGVAAVLYSSFGADWSGPLNSLLAYATYFRRGSEGGIHAAPWYEYLRLLFAFRPARGFFWTEGMIVGLAAAGAIYSLLLRGPKASGVFFHGGRRVAGSVQNATAAMEKDSRPPCAATSVVFCRFLTFYTLVLVALYSAIPYKTPWCLLSFLHGMVLLAGVGVYAILRGARWMPLQVSAGVILLAGAGHLGWETYWLNFRIPADQRNPYVYAHTSGDVLNLVAQMERLAKVAPDGHDMPIHVVSAENYWPLPWYLRRFRADHVGYWQDADVWAQETAASPPPAVILLTSDAEATVDAHLHGAYNRQMIFGLRPGVFVSAYVRDDLWQALMRGQAK